MSSGIHLQTILRSGQLFDCAKNKHPTQVLSWGGENLFEYGRGGAYFGYVYAGSSKLVSYHTKQPLLIELQAGMYFSISGKFSLQYGSGFLVHALHTETVFYIGGPVAKLGSLRYIDNCTDSLLIPPIYKGEPCLNYLYLPPKTRQRQHTHPSLRACLITGGTGRCIKPNHRGGYDEILLKSGDCLTIPQDAQHSFFTDNEGLSVIAYHPDSDFGPEHDNHPMLNRTYYEDLYIPEDAWNEMVSK